MTHKLKFKKDENNKSWTWMLWVSLFCFYHLDTFHMTYPFLINKRNKITSNQSKSGAWRWRCTRKENYIIDDLNNNRRSKWNNYHVFAPEPTPKFHFLICAADTSLVDVRLMEVRYILHLITDKKCDRWNNLLLTLFLLWWHHIYLQNELNVC